MRTASKDKGSRTKRRGATAPVNGKVTPPRRLRNQELRSREYLLEDEVEALQKAARKTGRHGHRNATLILLAFRHGLRAKEIQELKWDQVEFGRHSRLHVNRCKSGTPSVHPVRGRELRALRKLRRDYPDTPYVFVTERGGPMTRSNIRKIVTRAGAEAELGFPVHPHMLRHACGYYLANQGHDTRAIQDYLGHKSITHTVRYTQLTDGRFQDFWRD